MLLYLYKKAVDEMVVSVGYLQPLYKIFYYDFLDSRIGSISNKGTSYEIVCSAVSNILGSFTKAQVLEQCPTIGSSSVEAALKRIVGKNTSIAKVVGEVLHILKT